MESTEIWKDIDGYNGVYQVSNLGRVRRTDGKFKGKHSVNPVEGVLCESKVHGYRCVVLCKSGKTKCHRVHRLVMLAFTSNPDSLPAVNHIDGDKANNRLENLEWVSDSQNQIHRARVLMKGRHEAHNKAVLNWELAAEIRVKHQSGQSINSLAKEYGVSKWCIDGCVKYRTWVR